MKNCIVTLKIKILIVSSLTNKFIQSKSGKIENKKFILNDVNYFDISNQKGIPRDSH